ncbi:MAG: sodium/solute symporter [Phycisphaeraceae bacterium]|nr:MAG: sodium/solute symporter [Phycisphaeraceae bacterium]
MPGSLAPLDWGVILLYFALLAASGVWINRRSQKTTDDYFRGGGRVPAWAAAVSVVATSMSAASFIGVPQQAYVGDLTYLSTNIGMVLAAIVIAFVFVPAFYRARVQTIYAYLDTRLGEPAGRAASLAFMVGRVLASGARIYIGAIPASLVLFGDLAPGHLVVAIAVLSVVGVVYTLVGGVESVIWSDVIQMAILLGACIAAIVVIASRLNAGFGEAIDALASGGAGGASKLTLFDLSLDPHAAFSLPAAFIGFTIMGIGSYGVDQDLAQRLLTCRDAKAGARSIIGGILIGIPSVALFLVVGLLLFLFYQRPDLVAGEAVRPPDDSRQVFLAFIMDEMPAGLSGLMLAGLFAAGLSSLNSAINAMSSTFINDFYRRARPGASEAALVRAGRVAVAAWGVVLGLFACGCVWLYGRHAGEGGTLLTFALTVMTFAYAGLIGVFFTALFTKRGNGASAIAALIVGFIAVGLMQPMFWGFVVDLDARRAADPGDALLWVLDLAFVWKLTIASGLSFGVCVVGKSGMTTHGAG